MVIDRPAAWSSPLEAFLVSTGVVALGEMGDKTQLLALMLAARFRKPWPIVAGIFVATLVNHAIAGAIGAWLTRTIGPDAMRWILGLSFIAMAAWMLVPDKLDEADSAFAPREGMFTASQQVAHAAQTLNDPAQVQEELRSLRAALAG